jgi:flavin reductase (DIM6/NTAB) family NADH-FMN oxidoreductase RutF
MMSIRACRNIEAMSADRTELGKALGKIASGLYVITARIDGAPVGMLCSFVEQAGFDPPMISVAVGHGRPITAVLDGSGLFGLNILAKSNVPLMKTFARPHAPDAFTVHALTPNSYDLPEFTEAWAFLVCKVTGSLATGDHTVYIAEVLDGCLHNENEEAMVRVRAHGFGY